MGLLKAPKLLPRKTNLLLTILLWSTSVILIETSFVLDVYRLVQYDFAAVPFGSRRVRLSQRASLPSAGLDRLKRTVVLINLTQPDLDLPGLTDSGVGVSGIILILPSNYDKDSIPEHDLTRFLKIEKWLVERDVLPPVYFVVENGSVQLLIEEIQSSIDAGKIPTATSAGYMMQFQGDYPIPLESAKITNLQGWVPGSEGRPIGQSTNPTIVVAAHYDALGGAPDLSFGSDSNGSGVAALLQLLKLFGPLLSDSALKADYNMLFVLTGGATFNYAGSFEWLAQVDPRVRGQIEFVLCLDSLGGFLAPPGSPAYLHYSRPPKDSVVKNWYDSFEFAAKELDIPLELIHKKVNIAAPILSWEHEQFAKSRLFAATLSSKRIPALAPVLSSIFDKPQYINLDKLTKTVHLAAAALATTVFGKNKDILQRVAPDRAFLSNRVSKLSKSPRAAPFLNGSEPFVLDLARFLDKNSKGSSKQTFTLGHASSGFLFYAPTSGVATVYEVASLPWDVALLFLSALYLAALYAILCIATRGWREFLSVFKPRSKLARLKSG